MLLDDKVAPWKIIFLVLSLMYFLRDSSNNMTLFSVLRTLFKIKNAAATNKMLSAMRDPTMADPEAGKGVATSRTLGLYLSFWRWRHCGPSNPASQRQVFCWFASYIFWKHFPWPLQCSESHFTSNFDFTKISSELS